MFEYSTCMKINVSTLLTPGAKPGLLQTSLDIFYCLRHYGNFPFGATPQGKVLKNKISCAKSFSSLWVYSVHLNNQRSCLFNEVFAQFCEIRFAVIASGGGWGCRAISVHSHPVSSSIHPTKLFSATEMGPPHQFKQPARYFFVISPNVLDKIVLVENQKANAAPVDPTPMSYV